MFLNDFIFTQHRNRVGESKYKNELIQNINNSGSLFCEGNQQIAFTTQGSIVMPSNILQSNGYISIIHKGKSNLEKVILRVYSKDKTYIDKTVTIKDTYKKSDREKIEDTTDQLLKKKLKKQHVE